MEIDDQTYTGLTSDSDPLDVILSDGTLTTITEHSITVNGETAQLPEPANLTPEGTILSVNGWQVKLTESEYSNAHYDPKTHGGQDLFNFFNTAIRKVSAAADNAVDGISKIAGTIMGDSLAVSAAGLAGTPGIALDGFELTGSAARAALASGGQALDDFTMSVEMMDVSLNMVNTDLANGVLDPRIAQTGRVFNAIKPSAFGAILNEVKNLKNIIKILAEGVEDVAPKVVTAIRGKYKQQLIVGTGGVFSAFVVQLHTTRDMFPPPPPPPGNSTGNSTEPARKPFNDTEANLHAQTDFPIPLFHLWTKLFDQDEGRKINAVLGIHTSGPSYFTNMKQSVAILYQAFPGIAYMDRQKTFDEHMQFTEDFFLMFDRDSTIPPPANKSLPSQHRRRSGQQQKFRPRTFIEDTQAWPHPKRISWQKNLAGYDENVYKRDDSGGAGATIFIIDSGFYLITPALQVSLCHAA